MLESFIGEIRMFAGNFEPRGWMFCEGQLLPIEEYESLFQLIGTTYGGDGQNTFALPDLRGRLPLHQGNGFVVGETGGLEDVTLSVSQIPSHSHTLLATRSIANSSTPNNTVLAAPTQVSMYYAEAPSKAMNILAIQAKGGAQPHSNMQPYLCVSFIISLDGFFPSQH